MSNHVRACPAAFRHPHGSFLDVAFFRHRDKMGAEVKILHIARDDTGGDPSTTLGMTREGKRYGGRVRKEDHHPVYPADPAEVYRFPAY